MVWRDARWIMDCLQCVRSKQWVGAVPLGLVMGGDPPLRPDGEEEEESLSARLTWPGRTQRAIRGTMMGADGLGLYKHLSNSHISAETL